MSLLPSPLSTVPYKNHSRRFPYSARSHRCRTSVVASHRRYQPRRPFEERNFVHSDRGSPSTTSCVNVSEPVPETSVVEPSRPANIPNFDQFDYREQFPADEMIQIVQHWLAQRRRGVSNATRELIAATYRLGVPFSTAYTLLPSLGFADHTSVEQSGRPSTETRRWP
ncbi:hypothetical protein BD626DRAFT_187454 [Schizophyllum amplum]|uniref:Uncharacterized protein n=1 Tax=Schizophyllum amplum TaxID=97359 RepID=A0A550C015_9AGAR|nr:hypothetical protein BD626DRAFT_187454 [Auriculariopsis ampla]